MSLLRSQKTTGKDRPSLLITIRMIDKLELPIDPSAAWAALQDAFKDHAHLTIQKAEVKPDKAYDTSL